MSSSLRFWRSCLRELNWEAGENPARPRHCNRGGLATKPLTDKVGKAASPMKRESGDLPGAGWVNLRGKVNNDPTSGQFLFCKPP
jgi:hypothetical protein